MSLDLGPRNNNDTDNKLDTYDCLVSVRDRTGHFDDGNTQVAANSERNEETQRR